MRQFRPHAAHWGAFTSVVEDGRLVAVRPFGHDPAPPLLLGSIAAAVHAPSRIDRPYVREGWLAGDRAGGTLRGGERFVPLAWDRAVALVAGEIARVRDEHGPASIFGGSYGWSSAGRFHHARQQLHRMLAAAGGYTAQLTNYSYATGMTLMPHIVGDAACITGPAIQWADIARHARLMVCFGGMRYGNDQVHSGGGVEHLMRGSAERAQAAGVRLVSVSPIRGDAPGEWLPIRPCTDTALMLAMAHVLLEEGLADRDFLARCTVGFERLAAYVKGEADGLAKTPAWAAPITGIAPDIIAALARDCARLPTALTATWALQRAEYGEQPFWMVVALAAMLGGIGKPGLGFGFGHGSIAGMGTARAEVPSVSLPGLRNPAESFIPVARLTEMLESPGGEYDYNGRRLRFPDTRLIYWAGGNPFHHHQDLNRLLLAWAKPETIVVHEPWWTPLARHADIVLPATTTLERDDIGSSARDRYILAMHRAIPPQGEARDDFSIFADIADALGVRERFTEQRDAATWLRVIYERMRSAASRAGLEIVDFDRFWEAGFVEIPAPLVSDVPFSAFARDPAAHRLNTPSGRIEIFSERIAGFGYDDCPGHPVWKEPREYLGAPLAERFPLHLVSVQPATRLHGQMDQGTVSLESKIAGREPLSMHPRDAGARGLAAGDIVRVFNDRGACLAGLRLTEDVRPGVAMLPTGAWFDPLEPGTPGSLCVHGNPNVLTQDVGTSRLGQGPSAHSCLVEVERWDRELPPIKAHHPPPIAELA
jgi:biotin/methionine sulfoxide reductase